MTEVNPQNDDYLWYISYNLIGHPTHLYVFHFAHLPPERLGEALLLVHVQAYPLPEDQLHGCGMTELHHGPDDQIDSLVLTGHAVQADRVVEGRVPRCDSRDLQDGEKIRGKNY